MATENTNTRYAAVFAGAGDYTVPESGPGAIDLEFDASGNAKDLLVLLNLTSGEQATLTRGVDYTVSGRTVSVTTSTVAADKILIFRSTPATNDYDFVENQPFPASEFTTALNRLTFMVQSLQEQIDRIIKFPFTESIAGATLPRATERANKILSFDENGDVETADTFFQETIEGISSEDLGGGLTRVTLTFRSGAEYSFTVPSVGISSAPVANLFLLNQTISEDITIPSDKNGLTVGPVSVGAGYTVEVEDGANLVVIDQEGGL